MKTFMPRKEDIVRKWYVVDAKGQTLGRLASEVAKVLTGKNKPIYTPNVDTGDHVIIINAKDVVLTGRKLEQKYYRTYSGYIGGLKETKYKHMMETKPELVVMHAVKGMLPKNKLGSAQLKRVRVFAGETHTHEAQKPEVLTFGK